MSGTASEDRLTPTARSADITWSRDADEVFWLARVQGERVRLGHLVAAFTVQQILRAAGIGSAPRPARPGSRSCPPRAGGILAVDFVHVDTVLLLRRLHALIVIEL